MKDLFRRYQPNSLERHTAMLRLGPQADRRHKMCSMQRTTKTTKPTAACYAERDAECQDLLKRIASGPGGQHPY